ncbi:MAG: hypothetical protein KGZ43_11925, partial [Sulfuritalea sp.]|nr:hypothetical protein [Sulfuritalea sp.]
MPYLAGDGRNQIHVGLGGRILLPPAEGPGRAFAGGEVVVVAAGVVLGGEDRRDRLLFAGDLLEVAGQTLGIAPGLLGELAVGLLDRQRDLDAGQQHGLGAQQAFELGLRRPGRVEILRIGHDADARAGLLAAVAGDAERRHLFAACGKAHRVDLALAAHLDLDAEG